MTEESKNKNDKINNNEINTILTDYKSAVNNKGANIRHENRILIKKLSNELGIKIDQPNTIFRKLSDSIDGLYNRLRTMVDGVSPQDYENTKIIIHTATDGTTDKYGNYIVSAKTELVPSNTYSKTREGNAIYAKIMAQINNPKPNNRDVKIAGPGEPATSRQTIEIKRPGQHGGKTRKARHHKRKHNKTANKSK